MKKLVKRQREKGRITMMEIPWTSEGDFEAARWTCASLDFEIGNLEYHTGSAHAYGLALEGQNAYGSRCTQAGRIHSLILQTSLGGSST